jgi:hypothetical protein
VPLGDSLMVELEGGEGEAGARVEAKEGIEGLGVAEGHEGWAQAAARVDDERLAVRAAGVPPLAAEEQTWLQVG